MRYLVRHRERLIENQKQARDSYQESQLLSVCPPGQESRETNIVTFTESIAEAPVREAVRP